MTRYELLKSKLESQECFKMICGAGNENIDQIEKLAFVYTLAGATILDISANVDVVIATKNGIDKALYRNPNLDRPFIMVSIGMPGDHHVRKSYIDPNTCIGCGLCAPVCPTDAIPKNFTHELDLFKMLKGSFDNPDQNKEIVIKDLCIGCGKCSNVCPKDDIISYRHNEKELIDLLPKCISAGAETFELHAAVEESEITMKEWNLINRINPYNYNSICLDRLNMSNLKLEMRIEEAMKISPKMIVQADGYPMSGGNDDLNTTLQAISTADVINKKFNIRINKKSIKGQTKTLTSHVYRPMGSRDSVYIILSGGTNSKTKKLANDVGVRCSGVAIGTFARNIIEELLNHGDFWINELLQDEAVNRAKNLIKLNTEYKYE